MAKQFRFQGIVQGVGFRPWIYLLASAHQLKGWVFNDAEGVLVHVEGPEGSLQAFEQSLSEKRPPLARIDRVIVSQTDDTGAMEFTILKSRHGSVKTAVPADAATCLECRKELFRLSDKRYRYAFINCTHCGPRYTITRHLPYDRPQTSMSVFPMCPECRTEYENPMDRRFHAQPTCCPICGPQLSLWDNCGQNMVCDDPVSEAFKLLKEGKILAIKGLGGFHLVCDALNPRSVSLLRERKKRPSKPFAVMAANIASAERYLEIKSDDKTLLTSPAAPIVLCQKKASAAQCLEGIAPGLDRIGVMLPYTPIQWLLFFEAANRKAQTFDREDFVDMMLVMTSANASGEPLVIDNLEAVRQLTGIADAYLLHDREILIRCDDSLVLADHGTHYIRRARGYTPVSIDLPFSGSSLLATGAWFKNTACLTKGNKAYLTQHIGDLDRSANCETLQNAIRFLEEMLEIQPEGVVCDLHPDFFSSRLAEKIAQEYDVPLYTVQHHHAHIASVMASNALTEPVIGLSLDGVGLGTDGTSWGGEILRVDAEGAERLTHLIPLQMPGGDKCARQGWRMALAALTPEVRAEYSSTLPFTEAAFVLRLLQGSQRQPSTTSLGRIFDAAASLLGICHISSYEGEAAMLLEALARSATGVVRDDLVSVSDSQIDFRALLSWLWQKGRKHPAQAAADFHATLAYALAQSAIRQARHYGIESICVAGGCAINSLLMTPIRSLSQKEGFRLYEAKGVPANDGGIALGQAWAIQMKLRSENNLKCV